MYLYYRCLTPTGLNGVDGFVISSYCYNGYEANKNHGNHYAGKEMRAQTSQVVLTYE